MNRFRLGIAIIGVGLALGSCPVSAATITVNTTPDELNADGDCSLREAVRAANTNAAVDQCAAGSNTGTDTIVVPAGTYTLTIDDGSNDTGLGGDLDLFNNLADEDLVIDGAGVGVTIIQSCEVDQKTAPCPAGQGVTERVFNNLADAHTTIRDVTIRNGRDAFGNGAGIWNRGGVLTVRNCELTDNFAPSPSAGGAIFSSAGSGKGATLNVIDSTLSRNGAGNGAAIQIEFIDANLGSQLVMTGSTVSDNVSSGSAGGISNFGGVAVITNSTISGNSSKGGGGVTSQSRSATTRASLAIRSSTITNNTVVPSSGQGGGVFVPSGDFTLRNSIVAHNIDVHTTNVPSQVPDCSFPNNGSVTFTSEGYNLIGTNAGCPITGVTGDQIGTPASAIDPALDPLADNGGPTKTHLPAIGSPVVDSANPSAPGSGGFACPPTDQRGESRPHGSACDIGAVEVATGGTPLTLLRVTPLHGGTGGSVVAYAYGGGIVDGATVHLRRQGQPDIGGTQVVVPKSTVIAAQFDLSGAVPGFWDVVVTNPDTTSASLPEAFTIEAGGRADLWVQITVPRRFAYGRTSTVLLSFGNRGTVDAHDVPLWLSFSDDLIFHLPFSVTPPPAQPGQIAADWTQEAIDVPVPTPKGRDTFPLLLANVPAGSSRSLRFRLKTPLTVPPARIPLVLDYDIGRPYFDPVLRTSTVDLFVERAKQHATQVFGTTTFPPDAAIAQYVRTQLALVAASAPTAAATDTAAPVVVYSLAQLVVDVAQFVAGESETVASRDRTFDRWLASLVAGSWIGVREAEARIACTADPDCDPADFTCECTSLDPCEGLPPIGPCAPKDPPIIDKDPPKTCDTVNRVDDVFIFVPCTHPDPPAPPNPQTIFRNIGSSEDPNDKLGPNDSDGFVSGLTPIPYTVLFENLKTATNAALEVAITDQLDVSTLDLSTFSLGPIHFGITQVTPPPGLTSYTTDVDLRPAQDLLVRIAAGLDAGTGIASWHFTALDPATGELPEDPTNGFLPPNVASPEGEGGVEFTISPKPALPRGTTVCNDARIVFDFNAPIDTPEWCNVIGAPEDCANCDDDDGDGLVDRADPDCLPADGGGTGVGDADAAKALDKCAKGIRKVGSKLGTTHAKLVAACLKAVTDCVQLKPGDVKCLTGATAKCGKAKTSAATADTKSDATIAKACGGVAPANLGAVAGIGFAGEAGICAERGVASVDTLADVTACVRLQHGCAAEHLIAAAVPRAGELLKLGGWDPIFDLACIDERVNGGGTAIAADKRKALRKCDLGMQKAAAALGAGRAKALDACGAAVFTCVQAKPGDAGCLTKATGACTKAVGGLGKLGDRFTAAIAKACGAAPLAPADLLASEGLGVGGLAETCAALGVPALATVGDVSSCLARQVACRTDQAIRNATPRLNELFGEAGVPVP